METPVMALANPEILRSVREAVIRGYSFHLDIVNCTNASRDRLRRNALPYIS